MPISFARKDLQALLQNSCGELEVKCYSSKKFIKIDLKPENLHLWRETFSRSNKPSNLPLACEDSECDLIKTKLTWVICAAIRPVKAHNPEEIIRLPNELGVDTELSKLFIKNRPGLGKNNN